MKTLITHLAIRLAFGKKNIPVHVLNIIEEIVIFAFLIGCFVAILAFGAFVLICETIKSFL